LTKLKFSTLAIVLLLASAIAHAQIFTADARYKADILLVVAHPDDDTLATTYLARAIFDENKRVAVVYCTRGDSGANSEGREHGRALALVREIEGRRAMGFLGIHNIWFLDGRDTSSQNVLVSLGNWPSASVLEDLVRIFRLTRPEVVLTWLPSSVAGENHGDHQASGVLATEAFDMAGDRAVFPSQLAGPIRQFENALEGLTPWQAKKLYYFTDAFDPGFIEGRGPEYTGKEISPSRHVSYLQLAGQSAAAYYTQSPDPRLNRQMEAGKNLDEVLGKLQAAGYFPEPLRLWLGKSLVGGDVTGDVFQGVGPEPIPFAPPKNQPPPIREGVEAALGGPWGFYQEFWRAHDLLNLRFRRPEIAVQPNDTLTIPLRIENHSDGAAHISASVVLPPGWKQKGQNPQVNFEAGETGTVSVPVIAPPEEDTHFKEIRVSVISGGGFAFETSVFVKVSPWVAEQLKW
jgi:LmbE family N-acetylglucosaminyl deacetylase